MSSMAGFTTGVGAASLSIVLSQQINDTLASVTAVGVTVGPSPYIALAAGGCLLGAVVSFFSGCFSRRSYEKWS